MKIEEPPLTVQGVTDFFLNPPPFYLNKALTVAYVLSVLSERDAYGTELIQLLETSYRGYKLSDIVLYNVVGFLEKEQIISTYWNKAETGQRGRPRRMYKVEPDKVEEARKLGDLWTKNHRRFGYQLSESA